MNIEKLENLPWYVKPFIRLLGFIMLLTITMTLGFGFIILYIPAFILFGMNGTEKIMSFGSDAWELSMDLVTI